MLDVIDVQPEAYHTVNQWRCEQFAPGAPQDISMAERDLWHLDSADHEWRHSLLKDIPNYLARYFVERYTKIYNSSEPHEARRRANTFLRTTVGENILPRLRLVADQYRQCSPQIAEATFPFYPQLKDLPTLNRDELRKLSADAADYIAQAFMAFTEEHCAEQAPDAAAMRQRTLSAFRYLGELTEQIGTVPPYWAAFINGRRSLPTQSAESGILRMMTADWWLVRLKRRRDLHREHLAIAVGQVQKAASAYVSRGGLHEWIEQKKRNREFFKAFELEDKDTGQRVSMEGMVNGSSANPAIRRCELMVRMRGFEDLAKDMGCAGEFYTITAPSAYHAVHSRGGFVKQWNGADPRTTQKYLCKVWARARAALKREEISVFGFRVAEPHHDGTPHWHMLLFMQPCHVERVREILRKYAYEEDAHELDTPEARKARFHAVPIEEEKGSATGYIAKYISKNIDGYALDGEKDDQTGESLKDMAKSVSAWASRWRIRQFQQIGGAPVTVWRELRRLPGDEQILPTMDMDNVRFAADNSNWYAYTECQGGAFVKRRDLTVRLAYEITEQGNQYGEDVQRVTGVYSPVVLNSEVVTRLVKWAIVPKLATALAEAGVSGGNAAPWSSVTNCTPDEWRRLSNELKSRGFSGGENEINILMRGSRLKISNGRSLEWRNDRLIEVEASPEHQRWPGWN